MTVWKGEKNGGRGRFLSDQLSLPSLVTFTASSSDPGSEALLGWHGWNDAA